MVKAVAAIIAILIVAAVWWEVEMWTECRASHSFWLCLRVLSK